jgi:hypothetical protein
MPGFPAYKHTVMNGSARVYGEEIFFKFIEVPFSEVESNGDLVSRIKTNDIAGFIVKNVFTAAEIDFLKGFLKSTMKEEDFMPTPTGKIFPAPFAVISDQEAQLALYYEKLTRFNTYKDSIPELKAFNTKLDKFFKLVASNYKVTVPVNKIKDKEVAPGTFRMFYPGKGGLHVHCGNLFQAQSMFYYSLIKNDIDMDDQLSYFVVLQQSEKGGELTIYDMLWDKVKRKESPENNEFVIDDEGNHIYVDKIKSFAVRPEPGDILIFSGGPIWHRVEDIKGENPRITFGGFLNFSKNEEELYYWS